MGLGVTLFSVTVCAECGLKLVAEENHMYGSKTQPPAGLEKLPRFESHELCGGDCMP